jgi:single-strand DNA-binding protein
MYSMNQITIIGCTGTDAEAHYTQNGTLVVTLSVATKESWKDADGNWQNRTDWHRIVSFGQQTEFTRTLTKGSYVLVQGALRTREYERDGLKHRVVEVRADTVGKLDRAERRSEAETEPEAGDALFDSGSGHSGRTRSSASWHSADVF